MSEKMIQLHDRNVFILRVYSSTFDISQKNARPVHCRDCKGTIGTGLGIHRRAYRRNGYLCFSCLRSQLATATSTASGDGDAGFIFGMDGNLQACLTSRRTVTTLEVIAAVQAYLLDIGYDAADALIGDQSVNPLKISDVSESFLITQ